MGGRLRAADYGTGASCRPGTTSAPGFRAQFGLPVRVVVATDLPTRHRPAWRRRADGVLVNSGPLDGCQGGGDRADHEILAATPGEAAVCTGCGTGCCPGSGSGHADPIIHCPPAARCGPEDQLPVVPA